jgi:putative transposase
MDGIIPEIRFADKQKLIRRMRNCREAGLKTRYLIIVNLFSGRTPTQTAAALHMARSTVYRVAARFRQFGEWGLLDRREDNGQTKLSDHVLAQLDRIVRRSPADFGWPRPTWTRELLAATLKEQTGVSVHVTTLSRALQAIRARRGRPRPTVGCPWPKRRKNRRLRAIRTLVARLPKGHVAVYADEVDIHLNPKIGLDWMGYGQQKEVLTPGQNAKWYLAGALDARTGELTWVDGPRKNSALFIALLEQLCRRYTHAKVIHVILDNYRIHSSRITRRALAAFGGRIVLHFLPPYCPQENKIERLWLDLHAGVTRNHRCPTMSQLLQRVYRFLRRRARQAQRRRLPQAA